MKKSAGDIKVQKIGSEYSDRVSKANKQQDLMLQKKLRHIDRQQHLANTCLTRNIHEMERIQNSFETAVVTRSIDLKHYDQQRQVDKLRRYGSPASDKITFYKHKISDSSPAPASVSGQSIFGHGTSAISPANENTNSDSGQTLLMEASER